MQRASETGPPPGIVRPRGSIREKLPQPLGTHGHSGPREFRVWWGYYEEPFLSLGELPAGLVTGREKAAVTSRSSVSFAYRSTKNYSD